MNELIEALPKYTLAKQKMVLVDTCMFIYAFTHQKVRQLEEACKLDSLAMTSFNAEEFLYVHHRMPHIGHAARAFLKQRILGVVDVPIHPGEREAERNFMAQADPYLPIHAKDPSDGVLLAAAILTRSRILSRDRHDVFTADLSHYLQRYGIEVSNEFLRR